tara:strand:- start:460 stop:1101 length:642 start_codon:yes stop_codon:yes gene_type:complete
VSIDSKILQIKNTIPDSVELIAVSKKRSVNEILKAYTAGQRLFGENNALELKDKYQNLPNDIKWHMIGHLQSNKVKYIAPFVSLIHSIDSIKLLTEVNKRAEQNNRIIDCLLQIHIATETTKYGLQPNQVNEILAISKKLENINITGFMGMASYTKNKKQINNEFSQLRKIFNNYKNNNIHQLSMGMSSDYKIAIENGSNLVRIGSDIFGKHQ